MNVINIEILFKYIRDYRATLLSLVKDGYAQPASDVNVFQTQAGSQAAMIVLNNLEKIFHLIEFKPVNNPTDKKEVEIQQEPAADLSEEENQR